MSNQIDPSVFIPAAQQHQYAAAQMQYYSPHQIPPHMMPSPYHEVSAATRKIKWEKMPDLSESRPRVTWRSRQSNSSFQPRKTWFTLSVYQHGADHVISKGSFVIVLLLFKSIIITSSWVQHTAWLIELGLGSDADKWVLGAYTCPCVMWLDHNY